MCHSFFFSSISWIQFNLNLVTCTLAVITTILAAHQYGTATAANVLENLPNSNALYAATLLVTVQLCLSHAVGSSALFQNIEEYLRIPRGLCLNAKYLCCFSAKKICMCVCVFFFNFFSNFFF